MIYYKYGDATKPVADGTKVIVHIVNDLGLWGAGFSGALSKAFPEAEKSYRREFDYGNGLLRGTVQLVKTKDPQTWVANMVAQRGVRTADDPKRLDLTALEECLVFLARFWVDRETVSFHMPRIGCGLAGGTWDEVRPVLERTLGALHVDVTVYGLETST